MKKILVVGHHGKMGSVVFEELKRAGFIVVGKSRNDDFLPACEIEFIVEFGGAECSVVCADWCMKNGVPLVVGSTGQTKAQMQVIVDASKNVPVVVAGNFSLGILAIKSMIKKLKMLNIENVCIFEKHHKNKKDSPSGTALELAQVVEQELAIKPQILSLRGGKEIGSHVISLYFEDECIEIKHRAFSRIAFAKGVVKVAEHMSKLANNGLYSFEGVVGEH